MDSVVVQTEVGLDAVIGGPESAGGLATYHRECAAELFPRLKGQLGL